MSRVEQFVLAGYVMVHPGEAHAGLSREVPHRGGVIPLFREDPGRYREKVLQPLVITSHDHSNVRSGRMLRSLRGMAERIK